MPKIFALLLTLWMAPSVVAQDDPCGTVPDGVEVRFVFVVDCSGSMNSAVSGVSGPKRYEVVQQELNRQIDLLPKGDGVGLYLCAFSDEITTTLNYDSLSDAQRRLAKSKLSGPDFMPMEGAGTALRDAVISTLRDQQRWLQQDPTQRFVMVVILTDGEDRNSKASEEDLIREFEKIQLFERQFSCAGHLTAAEVYLNGPSNRALSNKRLARFVQGVDASKKSVQILPISVLVSSTAMTAHPENGRTTLSLDVNSSCPKELVQLQCPYSVEVEGRTVGSGRLPLANGNQVVELEFPDTFAGFDKETNGVVRLDISSLRSASGQPLTGSQEVPFTISAAANIDLDPNRVNIQPPSPRVGQAVTISYREVHGVPGVWSREDGGALDSFNNGWAVTTSFDTPGDQTLSLTGAPKAPRSSNSISISVPVIATEVQIAPVSKTLSTGDPVTFSASVTPEADVIRWRWELNGMKQASTGPELKIDELDQSGDLRLEVSAFLKSESGTDLEISNSRSVSVSEAPSIRVDADRNVVAGLELQVAIEAIRATQADLELRDESGAVVSKPGLSLNPILVAQSSDGLTFAQKVETIVVPFTSQPKEYELVVTSDFEGRQLEHKIRLKARPPKLSYKLQSPEVSGGVYQLGKAKKFSLTLSDEAKGLVSSVQLQREDLGDTRFAQLGPQSDGSVTIEFSEDPKDQYAQVREGDLITVTPSFFVGDQLIPAEALGPESWILKARHKSIEYSIVEPENQDGAEIQWGSSQSFSVEPMDDVASISWIIRGPESDVPVTSGPTVNVTFDQTGNYEISAVITRLSQGVAPAKATPRFYDVVQKEAKGKITFPEPGRKVRAESHEFEVNIEVSGSYKRVWLEWEYPNESFQPDPEYLVILPDGTSSGSSRKLADKRAMGIVVRLKAETPDGTVVLAEETASYYGPYQVMWPVLIVALGFFVVRLSTRLLGNQPVGWEICCSVGEPSPSSEINIPVRNKWRWWQQSYSEKHAPEGGITFGVSECLQENPSQRELVHWINDSKLSGCSVQVTSSMQPSSDGLIELEFASTPDGLRYIEAEIDGCRRLKCGIEPYVEPDEEIIFDTFDADEEPEEETNPFGLATSQSSVLSRGDLGSWVYLWGSTRTQSGNPKLLTLAFGIVLLAYLGTVAAALDYWVLIL